MFLHLEFGEGLYTGVCVQLGPTSHTANCPKVGSLGDIIGKGVMHFASQTMICGLMLT